MAFGATTCKVITADPATPLDELYEQAGGYIPEGFEAVRTYPTANCTVHLTIRREVPDTPAVNPNSRGSDGKWTDDHKLKCALNHGTFKTNASTWVEYCEDYLTSPQTSYTQKARFCLKQFINRGLPCACGANHQPRPVPMQGEASTYNGISLEDHIKNFPRLDCGKAISGEAFGRIPPSKEFYAKTTDKNTTDDQDETAQAEYEAAYLEISQTFRPIVIRKLRPGGENWLHVPA